MDTTLKQNTIGSAWTRFADALQSTMDLDVSGIGSVGRAQSSGAMTVLPLFGTEHAGFVSPSKGVRLARVHTYGDVELSCPAEVRTSTDDLAIVPLHMGFIQHGAQNHALCGSALIEPGKTVRFTDARCVQAAQGGLMEGRDQWFFVLPLGLRATALGQIGQTGYNNLWSAIEELNVSFGLPKRGHLEQLLTKQRATLTQFRSRFECLAGQTGALFFVGDRLAGIEIAPTASYFQDIWMPLISFAYGIAAYGIERNEDATPYANGEPFAGVGSLPEIRSALQETRAERDDTLATIISASAAGLSGIYRKTVFLHIKTGTVLQTVTAAGFAGQIVRRNDEAVYVSLFRTK